MDLKGEQNVSSEGYMHTRKPLSGITLDMVATAMGREPADLIIRNARLVNVNIARIEGGILLTGYFAYTVLLIIGA